MTQEQEVKLPLQFNRLQTLTNQAMPWFTAIDLVLTDGGCNVYVIETPNGTFMWRSANYKPKQLLENQLKLLNYEK